MNTTEIAQANDKLHQIKELEESIKSGGVDVHSKQDWHFGCGVARHKMEMLHAVKTAQSAATAVMESAANRQIKLLKDELKAMGVEFDV